MTVRLSNISDDRGLSLHPREDVVRAGRDDEEVGRQPGVPREAAEGPPQEEWSLPRGTGKGAICFLSSLKFEKEDLMGNGL